MAQQPLYEARYGIPSQGSGIRVSPAAIAQGGLALQRTADAAADFTGDWAEHAAKAQRAITLAKANNAATAEVGDLMLGLERDPDWATAPSRFKAGADKIREKYATGMKDPLARQEFELGFDRAFNPLNVSLKHKAIENGEKDALATLESVFDVQSRAVAGAPNGVAADQARSTAAKAVADLRDAGWIDPLKAHQEWRRFNGRVDEARVRRLMTQDPEAVQKLLDDSTQFAALDPVQRAQLADQAARRVDTLVRQRIANEEREDRLADKRLRRNQDEASKTLWDTWAANGGKLDVEAVRKEKGRLNEADYRALLHASLAKGGGADEIDAVRELKTNVDVEPTGAFEVRAWGLLKGGRITLETYKAEVDRNRSFNRDDMPASPFKSGREFVKVSLDPGQLGGDPTVRQPLAIAQQRALADFDSWAEKNGTIDRNTAMQKATELTAQYQTAGFSEMRLSLPRPRGYSGAKQGVAQPDIDRARSEVMRQLDAGQLPRSQAQAELDLLEVWEQVIVKSAGAK